MTGFVQRLSLRGYPVRSFRGAIGAPLSGCSPSVALQRDCRTFAGYKARVASLDECETKEYKIRKLADILGTSQETISSLVRLRPGLLVVPNGDMSFYEQRVSMLAFKHGVSPRQAQAMVLENPQLLFERV